MTGTKTDFRVQEDVVAELAFDPAVDASGIGVAVKDGIVTLTGTVPSYAMKLDAERAAMRVAGVRAVALDVRVDLPDVHQRTDADIAATVLQALAADVTLPSGRITVAVERGMVTLRGEVDWLFQREHAQHALAHHPGIRGIDNRITVTPRPSVADVAASIRRTLQRTAALDADKIEVEVKGDLAVLHGPVQSLAESRAVAQSAFIPGIARVQNLTYVKS